MNHHVTQLSLFSEAEMGRISLEEGLAAFRQCLKGKLNTHEGLAYLKGYMGETVRLINSINDQSYQLSRFICFVSFRPVLREIFGSKFVDRVCDTILANKLMPLLDQQLVDDNYSTRKGKGALYGVMRVYEMIRKESEDYTQDCWILKDDIKSFFMTISKSRSMQLWDSFIRENYHEPDLELLIATMRKIIFFRPELNCIRKGVSSVKAGIPADKILGSLGPDRGFPVGKIISQMTALLILDMIDHIVTFVWKIRNGHYMDDRIMVNKSRQKLINAKSQTDQMHRDIDLRTHPKKTYLQHYSKGVLFGGAMILPGRIYLSNRTVGNCFRRLAVYNEYARTVDGFVEFYAENFAQVVNSYLGQMCHYAEWNTMHRVIREIAPEWYKVMTVVGKKGRYKILVHPLYCQRKMVVRKHRCRMITLLGNDDNRRSLRQTARERQ